MFTKIEAWTYEGKEVGLYTFFEALELSGLTNKRIRLSADTQKKLLGANVFGKREIMVDEMGDTTMWVSLCFGTDYEVQKFHWVKIREALLAGKQIHPQCPNKEKYISLL